MTQKDGIGIHADDASKCKLLITDDRNLDSESGGMTV